MNENPAVPANAVIDGREIAVPAAEWRILREEGRIVRTLATGMRREQLTDPGQGYPLIVVRRRFGLLWAHAGGARQALGELSAVPGEHCLVLWRPEEIAYRGDESRDVFRLPNRWILAIDAVTPPGGLDPAKFSPQVRVGRDGDVLACSTVDDATFEGATPPAAGEVWFNAPSSGGASFRLPEPPAAGELIYATVVPQYRVLVGATQGETALREPLREPREVVLLET